MSSVILLAALIGSQPDCVASDAVTAAPTPVCSIRQPGQPVRNLVRALRVRQPVRNLIRRRPVRTFFANRQPVRRLLGRLPGLRCRR